MFDPTGGGVKTCNYLFVLPGGKYEGGNMAVIVERN
jgi:hypothetical protein